MNTKWFNELFNDLEEAVIDYKYNDLVLGDVDEAIDNLVLQARLDRTREILELLTESGKYMGAAAYVDWALGGRYPDEIARATECPLLDENGEFNDGRV